MNPTADQLRKVLRKNSLFSLASGLVAVLAFVPLADLFDVPRATMAVVGVGLVMYAPLLWRFAASTPIRRWHGLVPTAGDELWVVACLAIAATGMGGVSPAGRAILLASCIPVGMFGLRQWSLTRRLPNAAMQ